MAISVFGGPARRGGNGALRHNDPEGETQSVDGDSEIDDVR
jgi:hypothetical protein